MQKIEHEIVVQAPADSVYQVWRNFENFPSLMSNVEEVRDIGYGRSHWKAKGLFGIDGEWDAEITDDEPGRAIGWRSIETPESNVRTEGHVDFESLGDATRLHVAFEYDPPGGKVGQVVTKLLNNPDAQVKDDLQRFKERMEMGGQFDRATTRIVGLNADQAGGYTNTPEQAEVRGGSGVPEPDTLPAIDRMTRDETQQVRGKYPRQSPEKPAQSSGTAGASTKHDDPPAHADHDDAAHPEPRGGRTSSQGEPSDPAPGKFGQAPGSERGSEGASESVPRPTTTGTPGGTLGAPTEHDLKRDQEGISERTDTRTTPPPD